MLDRRGFHETQPSAIRKAQGFHYCAFEWNVGIEEARFAPHGGRVISLLCNLKRWCARTVSDPQLASVSINPHRLGGKESDQRLFPLSCRRFKEPCIPRADK